MKKTKLAVLLICTALLLAACAGSSNDSTTDPTNTAAPTSSENAASTESPTSAPDDSSVVSMTPTQEPTPTVTSAAAYTGNIIEFTGYDKTTEYSSATTIVFSETGVEINGSGASADGTTVTISAKGTYVISGTCSNGRIIASVADTEKLQLVLNGLTLTSADSSVIRINCADKTLITLAEGTTNTLEDGSKYASTETDANACIWSKDDLTINGSGTLIVYGNYNNGIDTSDDLKIVSGTISVSAKNNGIKGNDSIGILDGFISVTSKDDGIKTDNDEKSTKGCFYMENGTLVVKASDDGISAVSSVVIAGGSVEINAGDDKINCDGIVEVADGCMK